MMSKIKCFFKGRPKSPNDREWYHGDKELEKFVAHLDQLKAEKELEESKMKQTFTREEVASLLTGIYWRIVDGECPIEDIVYPTLVQIDAWDDESNEPKELEE